MTPSWKLVGPVLGIGQLHLTRYLGALLDQMVKVNSAPGLFWPPWLAGHLSVEMRKNRVMIKMI